MTRLFACILLGLGTHTAAAASLCAAEAGSPRFTVIPAASGEQIVRTSVPLPPGFLQDGQQLAVHSAGTSATNVGLRVLSWHPASRSAARSARRAMLTFPWQFIERSPVVFALQPQPPASRSEESTPPVIVNVDHDLVRVEWPGRRSIELKLIAPPRATNDALRSEILEDHAHFRWHRVHFPDSQWPRVIETRVDSAGCVAVIAHLQRANGDGHFAPTIGWAFATTAQTACVETGGPNSTLSDAPLKHLFREGLSATTVLDGSLAVYHPAAPFKRRGLVELARRDVSTCVYQYLRCRAEDNVPMQPMSWQRCEIVFAPRELPHLTPTLGSPHEVAIDVRDWESAYPHLRRLPALTPELDALLAFHHEAIVRSAAIGDDFGNVTQYSDSSPHGAAFGMNRLNHGAPIFEEAWRSNDRRLLATALAWTDNFHDQSIWWGTNERGGTRYNNVAAQRQTPPTADFMWRSNDAVSFCTKGYDSFWLAWEETGDPRFLEAFQAQIAYASQHLHAGAATCRNVGDVRDFVRLYQYTGEGKYLEEALRLFRELRTCLSEERLFSEGGKPMEPDPPFIEDDERGHLIGYAKPYIIGYALSGLPELVVYAPDEPQLKETIRAVADYLAETVDAAGGWRYPHPRSSYVIVNQGLEHAWQLTQAARVLGPEPRWLDAIETTLRARILFFQKTGTLLAGLEGWETSTGKATRRSELHDLYRKPADRDAARDYVDGNIASGSAPPEGLVYFADVLGYYLEHRPVDRLLAAPRADEPLGLILQRAPARSR